ncbi:energy transducer TonB [Asaia bogorensis]|uniref:energy transducer TonB n=1 Tax=Asaia bogorensis TaxID=91915 RepID=UPI001F11A185|nr:energy transducer TonB [Asaia bogorensis]
MSALPGHVAACVLILAGVLLKRTRPVDPAPPSSGAAPMPRPDRKRARNEPLLYAPTAKSMRALPPMRGTRAPLTHYEPKTGLEPDLKPAGASLIRPQILEDQGVVTVLIASAIAHAIILGLLIYEGARHARGLPEGIEQPQVEMMFAPPSRSGMAGPHEDKPGGEEKPSQSHDAPSASSPEKEQEQQPDEAESTPTPAVPTPTPPAAPPVPDGPSTEIPKTQTDRPVSPGIAKSGTKTQTRAHSHRSSRRPTTKQSDNPFANMTTLDFGEAPSTPRRQRGRRGGSGAPIDMSLGPLSTNGQINAPFMTRNSIRGVSDDYGSEIDRWIRAHLYYPEDAIKNGEDGPSSVHVVLDRTGRVKSVRLTGQSGSYSLDAATTGMFQGAHLPPVPPDMKGDHFDIDLTINYILIRR